MIVTGTTTISRLAELKKYRITDVFTEQYIGGGSTLTNGVDYANSISGICITYYIDGIKYIDDVPAGITTFQVNVNPSIQEAINFIDESYYKDTDMGNVIGKPKINNDILIERQETSAFESNYRLMHVCSFIDLITYAGGKYFKIVCNG